MVFVKCLCSLSNAFVDQCLCSLSNVKCCVSIVFVSNFYVPCQMSNVVCQMFSWRKSMFLIKCFCQTSNVLLTNVQCSSVQRFCDQRLCSLSNVKCSLSNIKCCLSKVLVTKVYVPFRMSNVVGQMFSWQKSMFLIKCFCQTSNVLCQMSVFLVKWFCWPMSMFLVKCQMLCVQRFCVKFLCSSSNVKCCLSNVFLTEVYVPYQMFLSNVKCSFDKCQCALSRRRIF